MAKATGKKTASGKRPAAGKRVQRTTGTKASKRARKPSVATGPLTLAEARAAVQARTRPAPGKRASGARASGGAGRGFKAAVATIEATSPGAVGAERERLQVQRRRENQRRIREYAATLELLKQRGVKGLAARARAAGTAAAAGEPLQILAEGDSWFDYPVPFFGGGIIPRLEERIGVPILNLAKAGDEVRYMLGVEERKLLAEQLTQGCPAGGPWDVLLFSGGGNDVVDNPMALWVKDFDPGIPLASHINQPRFDAVLALVRAGYEDLIAMRNALSPGTHIFFHAYDFAIPDGRGICHLGPWLKPTFDLRGFPNRDARIPVVKAMLQQFAAVLQSLTRADVTFINAQGTLEPKPSAWHNELHPSDRGFDKFAKRFHQELKAKFPGRVL
jgi:hypothetical protein